MRGHGEAKLVGLLERVIWLSKFLFYLEFYPPKVQTYEPSSSLETKEPQDMLSKNFPSSKPVILRRFPLFGLEILLDINKVHLTLLINCPDHLPYFSNVFKSLVIDLLSLLDKTRKSLAQRRWEMSGAPRG